MSSYLIHSEKKLPFSNLLFCLFALSIWNCPPPWFFFLSSSICLSYLFFYSITAFTWGGWPILYKTGQPEKDILFYAVKQALILIDFVNIILFISALENQEESLHKSNTGFTHTLFLCQIASYSEILICRNTKSLLRNTKLCHPWRL